VISYRSWILGESVERLLSVRMAWLSGNKQLYRIRHAEACRGSCNFGLFASESFGNPGFLLTGLGDSRRSSCDEFFADWFVERLCKFLFVCWGSR